MDFEYCFPAKYTARVVLAPRVAEWRCYPGAVRGGRVAGIGVEFSLRNGNVWFASFAEGSISPTGLDFAGSAPGGGALVVSTGEGYLVDPENPEKWQAIPLQPIKGLLVEAQLGVVVLWDFTRFVCIDGEGIRWRSPSLSWDGFRDVAIVGEKVLASAWDAPTDTRIPVQIAVADGTADGGSSPELTQK